jgi:hypothetical protein
MKQSMVLTKEHTCTSSSLSSTEVHSFEALDSEKIVLAKPGRGTDCKTYRRLERDASKPSFSSCNADCHIRAGAVVPWYKPDDGFRNVSLK